MIHLYYHNQVKFTVCKKVVMFLTEYGTKPQLIAYSQNTIFFCILKQHANIQSFGWRVLFNYCGSYTYLFEISKCLPFILALHDSLRRFRLALQVNSVALLSLASHFALQFSIASFHLAVCFALTFRIHSRLGFVLCIRIFGRFVPLSFMLGTRILQT